jgi:HSP20 family protein
MSRSLMFPGDLLAEFERLQEQLDQAFRSSHGPASIRAMARGSFPPINVGTTPETIEVVAFAPGIDPQALQLSIDKGLLILAGERKKEVPAGGDRVSVYARERFGGPFRRVVSLPEDADPGRVTAKYRDGFLRVSIAKRESSKPRHIEVH